MPHATYLRRIACAALTVSVLLTLGCVSRRERVVMSRAPRNQAFTSDSVMLPLEEGEAYAFAEFERTRTHNLCLLRLARDASLSKRFHADHDMILLCSAGKAIVIVEDTRYAVAPGSVVVIPSLTAYSVLPNDPQNDFAAVMIFSPPFDGRDTFLED